MRQITIPETLNIDTTDRTPRGPVTSSVAFSFFQFLAAMLLSDRRFNSNAEGAFAAERITAAMKAYDLAWATYEMLASNAAAIQLHVQSTYNAACMRSSGELEQWSHDVARLESEADAAHDAAMQAWSMAIDRGDGQDHPPERIAPVLPPRPEEPAQPDEVTFPAQPRFWLTDDDGELLKAVIAEPTDGYPIKPLFVVASYLRAVAEQTEVPNP